MNTKGEIDQLIDPALYVSHIMVGRIRCPAGERLLLLKARDWFANAGFSV
jgi:hypothetical protein